MTTELQHLLSSSGRKKHNIHKNTGHRSHVGAGSAKK